MLSLLIVLNKVISDTPTCFFLNPSFQSAYIQISDGIHANDLRTLATLACFFAAGVTFFPAFLDGACKHIEKVEEHVYESWQTIRNIKSRINMVESEINLR